MDSATVERLCRNLDWNLLFTFMIIVEERSISRAADRLLLKQPTVTNALKRLEVHLGRRLIDRGSGVFVLTNAGELLFQECVEIYGSVSRLAIVLRQVEEQVTGHIEIGLATHIVTPILDDALTEFHHANPKATFTLTVGPSERITNMVKQKTASLGICLVYKKAPGLNYQHAYRAHFGLFCGRSHRLFGRKDLTFEDIRNETYVSFPTDHLSGPLRPIALLRAEHKFAGPIVGQSSHLEEVVRMISAGLGIGPLPLHVAKNLLAEGSLWRLPPYDLPPAMDIHLVTNPRARLNRAESRFIELLSQRIVAIPLQQRTYPLN